WLMQLFGLASWTRPPVGGDSASAGTANTAPAAASANARRQREPFVTGAHPNPPAAYSLLDDRDRVARGDRAALGYAQLLDLARRRRGDLVLHLHRLDHADQRALVDLRALL